MTNAFRKTYQKGDNEWYYHVGSEHWVYHRYNCLTLTMYANESREYTLDVNFKVSFGYNPSSSGPWNSYFAFFVLMDNNELWESGLIPGDNGFISSYMWDFRFYRKNSDGSLKYPLEQTHAFGDKGRQKNVYEQCKWKQFYIGKIYLTEGNHIFKFDVGTKDINVKNADIYSTAYKIDLY